MTCEHGVSTSKGLAIKTLTVTVRTVLRRSARDKCSGGRRSRIYSMTRVDRSLPNALLLGKSSRRYLDLKALQ